MEVVLHLPVDHAEDRLSLLDLLVQRSHLSLRADGLQFRPIREHSGDISRMKMVETKCSCPDTLQQSIHRARDRFKTAAFDALAMRVYNRCTIPGSGPPPEADGQSPELQEPGEPCVPAGFRHLEESARWARITLAASRSSKSEGAHARDARTQPLRSTHPMSSVRGPGNLDCDSHHPLLALRRVPTCRRE